MRVIKIGAIDGVIPIGIDEFENVVSDVRINVIDECIDELKKYIDEDSWCIELLEQLKERKQ